MENEIIWIEKDKFNPVEGKWYWVIMQNPESPVGFYVPYSAIFQDGFYIGGVDDDVETDNHNITHVAEIVYPKTF